MKNNIIEAQTRAIDMGLNLGRRYLDSSDFRELRNELIKNRIELRRISYARSLNPAAAVFGDAQVGKSYMVDSLLTTDTNPLTVYDAKGTATGFIEQINPFGFGKEATGLITRFTSKEVWKDENYPVKVVMLSPVDLVLTFVESYTIDDSIDTLPDGAQIEEELHRLKEAYSSASKCQDVISEDDIYELREYYALGLMEHCPRFQKELLSLDYFETLSELIDKVSVDRWADVFSFLWNRNPIFTEIFNRLIATLQRLDFSRTVYIKIDAFNRITGTILHVDRIYDMFGLNKLKDDRGGYVLVESASETDMEVMSENWKVVNSIEKSVFSALAMEVDFTIVDPTSEKSKAKLFCQKPFLKDLDVLDFPGVNSRYRRQEADINCSDASLMFIRGKVAYLFNKYSQQYLISNLLFCQHDTMSCVLSLKTMLKRWVDNNVGATPEERAEFMRNTKVPPLFIICTKLNVELRRCDVDTKGTPEQRENEKRFRWFKRFGSLSNVISSHLHNPWENQWVPGEAFKNIYLLRSFEYSCLSGLYEGYMTQNEEGEWKYARHHDGTLRGELCIAPGYVEFIRDLRQSFIENDYVINHFEDPGKSWDEAVLPGKDGSTWIIENLFKSGRNTWRTRDKMHDRIVESTMHSLCNIFEKYSFKDKRFADLRCALEKADDDMAFESLIKDIN